MNSSMNSDPNSALSQNWVECTVCTPKAQVARTLRSHNAQTARTTPCRGALGAISWFTGCHIMAPGRRVMSVSQAVSRHKGRPPATIQTIVSRHTPVASCRSPLSAWPCRGPLLAVSWPCWPYCAIKLIFP